MANSGTATNGSASNGSATNGSATAGNGGNGAGGGGGTGGAGNGGVNTGGVGNGGTGNGGTGGNGGMAYADAGTFNMSNSMTSVGQSAAGIMMANQNSGMSSLVQQSVNVMANLQVH
ncbi:hypothetical protein EUB48_06130 [Rhodoferax sediminis]|uniref:Uncharacterized protein n=1 Tax=Rhodoferax sediminis TaxID=2509614 RepID=A0A515D961_9BURK|nr:hypothetical protein EUB48_06130 [Rhodoferax sediminis]